MAVIYTQTNKVFSQQTSILGHVLPQPRAILRPGPVSQLDTVSPHNNFSAKIYSGFRPGVVDECISSPNPAIVDECLLTLV